jgi:flavin-dependent dehydrogenase
MRRTAFNNSPPVRSEPEGQWSAVMKPKHFDIAVIGGGPAGTAAAICLSKAGYSVLVIETSKYEKFRPGETLPPNITPRLQQLGVFDRFLQQKHSASAGITSAWGKSKLDINDFLFGTYGNGWQVDRVAFDHMLAHAAAAAGATVWTGTHLLGRPQRRNKTWEFQARHNGEELTCRSIFLVDATGRCGTPSLCTPSPKLVIDGLIGIVWTGKHDEQWSYTLVESIDDGWFYSTSLPGRQALIAYMTDCDIYREKVRRFPNTWWRDLHRTTHTHKKFPAAADHRHVKLFSAATTWREPIGESWCAVGDATISFDPLSGLGVQYAIDSAVHAADSIRKYLAHNQGLDAYRKWMNDCAKRYLLGRQQYYSRETRWPASRFWQRRFVLPELARTVVG